MHTDTQAFVNQRTALAAHLRGILGIHEQYLTTSFFRFVGKQLSEFTQSCIVRRQGKVRVLSHKAQGQVFQRNHPMILYHLSREFVPEISTLVGNPFVNSGYLSGGFAPSVASLPASGQTTLGNSELSKLTPKPARIFNQRSIAERK